MQHCLQTHLQDCGDRTPRGLEAPDSPNQASFCQVVGVRIMFVLSQEFVHHMRTLKAQGGLVMINLDLEKAYYRLDWGFLKESLTDAGLPKRLVKVIMELVTVGSCWLIWNGECTNTIKPSRGLWEGCPLLPYLFVLCIEKLGQWIAQKVAEGRLKDVKASRYSPGLNHLFFADDLLLFAEARGDQLVCLKEGLKQFCCCSGQMINYQKSSIFFSSNVAEKEANRPSELLGIPMKKELDRYLGHHIVLKGRDRERHIVLLQKIQSKVAGWKLQCLSRAGRLTLAQSVLGSIPMFNMQLECRPS